jgi:hypothetical protein
MRDAKRRAQDSEGDARREVAHGEARAQARARALGSARETVACLGTAIAWGDIDDAPMIRTQLDEIIGTLVRIAR